MRRGRTTSHKRTNSSSVVAVVAIVALAIVVIIVVIAGVAAVAAVAGIAGVVGVAGVALLLLPLLFLCLVAWRCFLGALLLFLFGWLVVWLVGGVGGVDCVAGGLGVADSAGGGGWWRR